jgi:hypothetical protein
MLLEFSFPQALILAAVAITILATTDAVIGRLERHLGPTGAGPLAELERLERLRRGGVVSQEEFEATKRELLGRV